MIRSRGHCNTMGTASTMGLLAEALGTVLPGLAGTPAPDSRLLEGAHATGRLAVELVAVDRRPSTVLTQGVVPQRDRRARRDRRIDQRRRAPARDRRPAGHRPHRRRLRPHRRGRAAARRPAAGRHASSWTTSTARAACSRCCARCSDLLDPTALTVTGRPLVDYLDDAPGLGPRGDPPARRAAAWPTPGSPCCAATSPRAARSSSRPPHRRTCCSTAAARWSSTRSRTSTPASTTPTSTSTPTRCWCCAAAAPRATRACPRCRTCRCRRKLLEQGVRDMVRVCDGRMSGTAYGTVVLHVVPEAAAGGPLALVADGDMIVLDVAGRSPRRRRARRTSWPRASRGAATPSMRSRIPRAAGSGSTSTTCCRPTPAPTSTSCVGSQRLRGQPRVALSVRYWR